MSEAALSRIAALIKIEDDLIKIPSLKQQFIKEKASIDANLNTTVQHQIDSISKNMNELNQSATSLNNIKLNLSKINGIYDDSISQIPDYELIRKLTGINQFLSQTNNLCTDIANFKSFVMNLKERIQYETQIVAEDIKYPLDNILRLHFEITQIRNMDDYLSVEDYKFSDDMKSIIVRLLSPVKSTVKAFEELLKEVIISITEAVKDGNIEMVQKLVRIIEYENTEDLKITLQENLQLTQKVNPISTDYTKYRGSRRNYMKFFYDKLRESLADTFDKCVEHFGNDRLLVFENLGWMEDEILFVSEVLSQYFPANWNISQFFQQTYHTKLHSFTMDVIKSDPSAEELLQILTYDSHYTQFISQLHGTSKKDVKSIIGEDLKNIVLDDYLQVIVIKMEEWTNRLIETETEEFNQRTGPPDSYSYHQIFEDDDANDQPITLEIDSDVYVLPGFKTPLTMLKEQAEVGIDSGYGKILVGVVQNWCRCYVKRIINFKILVDEEFQKYMSIYNNDRFLNPSSKRMRFFKSSANVAEFDVENMTQEELTKISAPGLIDYLIALGNTFEINTDRLQDKFLPLYIEKVHSNFHPAIKEAFEDTVSPSTELNAQIIRAIIDIIVNDLYPALSKIFTKEWWEDRDGHIIQQVIDTIYEYMADIRGSASYDIYSCTFALLLDTFIASYIRLGIQNILNGNAKKIDPNSSKRYTFNDAIGRDVQYSYVHLEELFTRRDKAYLMNSLRAIEFLGDLATCPDPIEVIPQLWENEILGSFYFCSLEYIKGIVLCRKDIDKNLVPKLMPILANIQQQYHNSVQPPVSICGTLTDFYYN